MWKKNSCKACASEKKILQTSGLKEKIYAPKIPPSPPVISNGPSLEADKSTNFCKLEATKYYQLLNGNITKTYKKVKKNQLNEINNKAKKQ